MPTYEYRCEKGHTFERFQRMTEPPVDTCPSCGARAERILSAGAGLLFKGSGFYITDYRSEAYKKAAAADSAGSADTSKSGESSKSGDAAKSDGSKSDGSKSDGSKSDGSPSKPGSGGATPSSSA